MAATDEAPQVISRSAQEDLAASLIVCMGRESAIHVCRLNGWAGVLKVLLNMPVNMPGKPEPTDWR